MKIFKWITDSIHALNSTIDYTHNESITNSHRQDNINPINPASSLPMTGSVDIHGNPFGSSSSISQEPYNPISDFNLHQDSFNHHNSFDNHYDPFRSY